jgi:hypothetical protein
MSTKNSSILSLRIRNPIIEQAEVIAKREGFKTLHAWLISLLELQIEWENLVQQKKEAKSIKEKVSNH